MVISLCDRARIFIWLDIYEIFISIIESEIYFNEIGINKIEQSFLKNLISNKLTILVLHVT